MPLQDDLITRLKPYCVETTMVWHRRWTPEWTINDFAEGLFEFIRMNKNRLTDAQLLSLTAGLIQQLAPYKEYAPFVEQLKPLIPAGTIANPEALLRLIRKYREKFIFIPPTESASAIVVDHGDEQEKYMSLMIIAVNELAENLTKLDPKALTFEIFLEQFNWIAEQRKKIAIENHANNAADFGTPRWLQENQQECTLTNLSGSNYKGLKEKCVAGMKSDKNYKMDAISYDDAQEAEKVCLNEAKKIACTDYENYFIEINQEKIPITHLIWNDKGFVYFLHTLPQFVLPILKAVFPIWQQAMQPDISPKELVRAIARIEYMLQHDMPWKRGSAAITQAITYALYKRQGYEIVPSKAGTAIYWEALAARSIDEFINIYENIFAVHPTALKAQQQQFKPLPVVACHLEALRKILSDVYQPSEAPQNTTVSYQDKSRSELLKLKERVDNKEATYDAHLAQDVLSFCQQHETSSYAKKMRDALTYPVHRKDSVHQLILWEVSAFNKLGK